MNSKRRTLYVFTITVLILAVAGTLAAAALTKINVSFKLDRRVHGPTYGGDLWVSPPTFTAVQGGQEVTVEARAEGVDAQGKPVNISPIWIAADPDTASVSPGRGRKVKISVKRAGQTSLEVVSPGGSKKMSIKAMVTHEGKSLQVEITQ
jgi:hypothetical protein